MQVKDAMHADALWPAPSTTLADSAYTPINIQIIFADFMGKQFSA